MKSLTALMGIIFLFSTLSTQAQLQIALVQHATGFNNPVVITNAGDSRMFIVEKSGNIKILNDDGTTNAMSFLDVSSLITSSGERGLLGLAFHPDYSTNGFFYIHYTNLSGDSRVARYTVSANPDVASAGSALIILAQSQPASNHNAGAIKFGPDGYLYVPYGDGGGAGDTNNLAQNTTTFLGKMLRLDVDGGTPYAIPGDNPFVGDASVLDEIWSIGLRNPWRFSFDALTGDMWIGDVGQGVWEEIDFELASSAGGLNYGWRCKEGLVDFNTTGCGALTLTDPISVYNHSGGACSVTGGYVYRGTEFPNMYGRYFYTDYCNGQFRTLEPDGVGGWDEELVSTAQGFGWNTFGQDANNELYVANASGIIFQVTDPNTPVTFDLVLNVLLEGPYNTTTDLMADQLRVDLHLPLVEPYTSLGFTHVNGGGETTNNGVLAITGADAIVDWVFVEIRSAVNPSTVLATKSALVQRDGDVVREDGISNLSYESAEASVFVAVRHRNHFGVRTADSFSTASLIEIDFSDLALPIFGSNPTTISDGKNLLISGDANGDGQVNSVDKNTAWRVQNGATFNYLTSTADMNNDGTVNSVDKNSHWRPNNSKVQQLD
ncbi:MAG: glucose/arabinose dehydrogenase [Patiriisocius sp.]|jgi:glucose/arabinose dehydrogenase